MKPKTVLGWTILLILVLAPVAAWYFLGPSAEEWTDYSSITHTLGELTALVALTMMALTFVLSTRIKFIEDIFGGLDKVYIAHGILGGSALIMILAHPILLVLKFVPSDMYQAAVYLLPSAYWSVNFGIIALLGLIGLIVITLFTKLKYNTWKFTHEFLGLVFIFALLHAVLVRNVATQDNIFNGYYWYTAIVGFIGLSAFSYSLFLKDRLFKAATYTIKSITQRSENTFELILSAEHKPISYRSGQFIFVRFYNEQLSKEAHPFSIASRSDSPDIKIIVKQLGDFTSKIVHLRRGDKVSVEGPYGRFNYHGRGKAHQVWIAAGIGITPFIGMAEDIRVEKKLENTIDLYYAVKNGTDFVGLEELNAATKVTKNFRVFPWVTSDNGHLTTETIERASGGLKDKEFYLCGPSGFKEGIIHNLLKAGVAKEHIHTEEFDFR